jgi:hypothetical protein
MCEEKGRQTDRYVGSWFVEKEGQTEKGTKNKERNWIINLERQIERGTAKVKCRATSLRAKIWGKFWKESRSSRSNKTGSESNRKYFGQFENKEIKAKQHLIFSFFY